MTAAEHLSWEREQPQKHEFHRREVFATAGGSPRHNFLSAALLAELRTAMRGRGCHTLSSDQRIQRCGTTLSPLTGSAACVTWRHMKSVNVRDLHLRTGAIVDLAARGQVVRVVRRGVAVADLRPIAEHPSKPLPDRTKALAKFPKLTGDSGRFLEQDRS